MMEHSAEMTHEQVLCTIAGSDTSGGAGIQADLRTFALHGWHGTSVTTAITAQNTLGVHAIDWVDKAAIQTQFSAIFSDFDVAACKIGMIGDLGAVETLSALLPNLAMPLVIDPVHISSSGTLLLPKDAISLYKKKILPLAACITPNVQEAHSLLEEQATESDPAALAKQLAETFGTAVLVTGGDIEDGNRTRDWLCEAGKLTSFAGTYVDTPHTHGTGCHFSAALTCHLGAGKTLEESIRLAKRWLEESLRHGMPQGKGISSPGVYKVTAPKER